MNVKINGRQEAVEKDTTIAKLISDKGFTPEHIVVEYNLKIVPKEEWGKIYIGEDDRIEIVSFVGGG